ncbi:hypothetical protein SMICM304S_01642 [Streptomyces microflavus]
MSQLSEFVVHVGRRLRLRPRRVRVLLEVGCPAQRIGHRRDRRPTAGRDDRGGITRITRNRPLRLVAELAGDHRYLAAHTVEQGLRRGGVLQLLSCHGDGLSRSIGVVRTRFVPCLASAVVAALGDQAPLVVRGRRLGPRLSHQPVVERVGRLVPVDMVEGLRRDDGRTVPAGLVREGLSGRVRKGRRRAGRHPDLCSAAERVVRCHGDPAVGIGHLLRQPAQRVNIGGHLMAERVGDHSLGRYLAHRRRVDGPGGFFPALRRPEPRASRSCCLAPVRSFCRPATTWRCRCTSTDPRPSWSWSRLPCRPHRPCTAARCNPAPRTNRHRSSWAGCSMRLSGRRHSGMSTGAKRWVRVRPGTEGTSMGCDQLKEPVDPPPLHDPED